MNPSSSLIVRWKQRAVYAETWVKMKSFTAERQTDTADEIWLLEHEPVYTQGQNGKPEHLLRANNIPVIETDRGGQITYHGPGQLMVYTLFDLKRHQLSIRGAVTLLENAMIDVLANYQVLGVAKPDAPGVYVDSKKIGSIGLRVKKGALYHGIAFNVKMDLTPFDNINPCGYASLKMTQLQDYVATPNLRQVGEQFVTYFQRVLGYTAVTHDETMS